MACPSLHFSKCQIVGNLMLQLNYSPVTNRLILFDYSGLSALVLLFSFQYTHILLFSFMYCKFRKFREGFIFAKLRICEVL